MEIQKFLISILVNLLSYIVLGLSTQEHSPRYEPHERFGSVFPLVPPPFAPFPLGGPIPPHQPGGFDAGPSAYPKPGPPPVPSGEKSPPMNPPSGPPPFGFMDPGFQTQSGFDGFLVPNTWYGLLPWGIEGVIIVIAGIIVFAIVVIAIIGLLGWLCGIKAAIPFLKDNDAISSRFNDDPWTSSNSIVSTLTENVHDAIDKWNELTAPTDSN